MLGLTGNETPLDKATSWDSSQPFDAYSVKDTLKSARIATILTPFSIPYLYSADFELSKMDVPCQLFYYVPTFIFMYCNSLGIMYLTLHALWCRLHFSCWPARQKSSLSVYQIFLLIHGSL